MPYVLFMVNASELPNELSTCVCAAKCITVSICSVSRTYISRSGDRISPLMNLKLRFCWIEFRLFNLREEGGGRGEGESERVRDGCEHTRCDNNQWDVRRAVVELVKDHDLEGGVKGSAPG